MLFKRACVAARLKQEQEQLAGAGHMSVLLLPTAPAPGITWLQPWRNSLPLNERIVWEDREAP